jgi:hypothetical protein
LTEHVDWLTGAPTARGVDRKDLPLDNNNIVERTNTADGDAAEGPAARIDQLRPSR